jgi:hypothetical protein
MHTHMSRNLIIQAVLALIGLALVACPRDRDASSFAQPVGELRTAPSPALQANIESFMESQKSELDRGKENYHCASILYGYDDRYAYAWVLCEGHVREDGAWQKGSGFSAPVRLEYASPDLRVVDHKMPGDGSTYMPTLKQLFPRQMYKGQISNAEVDALSEKNSKQAEAMSPPTAR